MRHEGPGAAPAVPQWHRDYTIVERAAKGILEAVSGPAEGSSSRSTSKEPKDSKTWSPVEQLHTKSQARHAVAPQANMMRPRVLKDLVHDPATVSNHMPFRSTSKSSKEPEESSESKESAAATPGEPIVRVSRRDGLLPSAGSRWHGEGACRPCAHAFKPHGCTKGAACCYCHLCGKEEYLRHRYEGKRIRPASAAEEADALPSVGSAGHARGVCRPCAHAWRPNGCFKGQECPFCHVCGEDDFRTKRKLKAARRSTRERQPKVIVQSKTLSSHSDGSSEVDTLLEWQNLWTDPVPVVNTFIHFPEERPATGRRNASCPALRSGPGAGRV